MHVWEWLYKVRQTGHELQWDEIISEDKFRYFFPSSDTFVITNHQNIRGLESQIYALFDPFESGKVYIFWEGHKIFRIYELYTR